MCGRARGYDGLGSVRGGPLCVVLITTGALFCPFGSRGAGNGLFRLSEKKNVLGLHHIRAARKRPVPFVRKYEMSWDCVAIRAGCEIKHSMRGCVRVRRQRRAVCGRRFYKGCTKYRSGLGWRRELSLNSEAFNSSTPSRDARRVEVASPAIYLPLIFTRGAQTRRTLTTPFEFAATSTDSSLRHAHALMKPRGSFASRANPMDAMGDERSLR